VDGGTIIDLIAPPVTFYVPGRMGRSLFPSTSFGQLFADFNSCPSCKASSQYVTRIRAISIFFASDLARRPFIAEHGGMEARAASLGKKSTALVVQTVLVRTVRGA